MASILQESTPTPVVPVMGWTVDGTPVVGESLGFTETVGAAAIEVTGTPTTLVNSSGAGVNEISVTLPVGSAAVFGMVVVLGGFLVVRWIVKSIPFL